MRKNVAGLTLGCFLWLFSTAIAQQDWEMVRKAFQSWKTVRIYPHIIGGDHVARSPFLLLQRLDAERVVLSAGEGEGLPVAKSLISNLETQKIIDQVIAFYMKAEAEKGFRQAIEELPEPERTAFKSRMGFGPYESSICIEILAEKGSYNFKDEFGKESSDAAFNEFISSVAEDKKK